MHGVTNVVCLQPPDRGLLRARWVEHDNSHLRMYDALLDAGATDAAARLKALRRVEMRFDLDLAEICHRHSHLNQETTHAIERMVVEFITEERHHADGMQLWVMPERVLQVRELMDGKLVGDIES
jgi:hypothetical protein